MSAPLPVWILRVLLLPLPFTTGAALGDLMSTHSGPVRWCVLVMAWVAWGITIAASMVPHPITLTTLRLGAPFLGVGAAGVAIHEQGALGLAGAAIALAAVAAALSAAVADACIDGRSYGDERRFTLRIPASLLFGPAPLAWLLTAIGVVAGPLLLSAKAWIVGAVVTVAGYAIAWLAVRSLHSLSLRFVVFVPAGMTLVDPLILVESILFARSRIIRLGPALADTTALDLSQNAVGLVLEVETTDLVEMAVKDGRKSASEVTTRAALFTPSRPGAVLAEASRRRISVA